MSQMIDRRSALKLLGSLGIAVPMTAVLSACGQSGQAQDKPQGQEGPEQTAAEEDVTVRVASLKGPTSIGLADLMVQEGTPYEFSIFGTADEVNQKVISGDVDIALVPSNVSSVLYAKTDGKVRCIDLNTLSVLCLIDRTGTVTDLGGLAGKTVYMTGKGTTPQYTMEYLLGQAGLADQVTLEYGSEPSEALAQLQQHEDACALLPQPYATVALSKVEGAVLAFNLGIAWTRYAPEGSQLVTGVTIVRSEFLDEHPSAVTAFIEAHKASVEAVNADPAAAAKIVAEKGIIDNEAVVAKAIPECGIVCTTGDEMEEALEGYLSVLHGMDPSSVGGSMPEDDFYWLD